MILNFADTDHPLLVELNPLPSVAADAAPSAPSSSSSSSSASAAAVAANSDATVAAPSSSSHSTHEITPRLPLWSRFISMPFCPVAPATAAAATASAAAAAAAPSSTPPTPVTPAAVAMSDDAAATPAAPAAAASTEAAPATAAPVAPAAAPATTATVAAVASSTPTLEDNAPNYTRWNSTVALFDRSGRFIFEGNSKGTITLYQMHIDAAALESYRSSQPSSAATAVVAAGATEGSESHQGLPPYLSLRLVFVEALTPVNRRSRPPVFSVHALAQSSCGTYLLANLANQLRVYRVDGTLLAGRGGPDAEQALTAMAAHCASDPETKEILANGGRYFALPPSKSHNRRENAAVEEGAPVLNKKERQKEQRAREKKRREEQRAREQKEREERNNNEENKEQDRSANNSDAEDDGEGGGGGGAGGAAAQHGSNGGAAGGAAQPVLEYLRTFIDHVNRVPWRKCCFSHSSDFLVAGSSERGEHRIHIWSIHTGQLTKILLGPTEGLLDLVAHPTRPVLITCCTSGAIYVWNKKYVENWSAFAPDFEELDDNQEYVEREDEFDLPAAGKEGADHKGKAGAKGAASEESKEVFVDIAAEDDDSTGNRGGGGYAGAPPRGSAQWMREQLISLPTTVLPDSETAAEYQARRKLALEMQEKKKQAAAAAAATAASPMSAADASAPPTLAAKRPLEQSTEASDEANKKARI